ncbi:phosphotransferase family protein [Kutzneria chonburiensis]|uniref:Phosphotransferase family protein n=1 Tax=Kutzneria chonburiensis TaxID=1483604 RepID=A0ABV6ML82_9PSEU|nr:aminoglycoside phosphotransferase family protein [Kutzneria chonburiensis]
MNLDPRGIAAAALGRDPGPLTKAASRSNQVYLGTDIVVKLNDRHTRLSREIALTPYLPAGITAPLLASGQQDGVNYACYTRLPGSPPRMDDIDAKTARTLAVQAIDTLERLHDWTPPAEALPTLRADFDHGGFTSKDALQLEIDRLKDVPQHLVDGLKAIAGNAPERAKTTVPVHADCFWDNWLSNGETVTALLDFEWARFGEPMDDWFFLIRFSGRHEADVLDLVAEATATHKDVLRTECEAREAYFVAYDLNHEPDLTAERLSGLEELIVGRHWWRSSKA